MILETKKSLYLQMERWGLGKASGSISVWARALWTRSSDGVSSSSRTGQDQCLSGQPIESNFYTLHALYNRLNDTHLQWWSWSSLLSWPILILISSGKSLTQSPPVVFNPLHGHPMAPIKSRYKINHHIDKSLFTVHMFLPASCHRLCPQVMPSSLPC